MKGDRYHDKVWTIGKLQMIIRAEEHRDNTHGLCATDQFYWAWWHKYKLRWWRYEG